MSEIPTFKNLGEMPPTCISCKHCPAQGCDLRAHTYAPELAAFSRRSFVAASAGSIALTTVGGTAFAQTADSAATAAAATCVTLTPERTEGPYYIDDLLLRDDITEGKEGVQLDLAITVIDAESCEPLADVAVDIWHCDALGDYSGVGGQMGNDDTTGQTWMRGVQLTGEDGIASIRTIYPGWYVGRSTHIHLKVHVGGSAEDGTYLGGTTAHTGQLFFDDELTDQVAQLAPYNTRIDVARTLNSEDGVLGGALTEPGFWLGIAAINANDLNSGFTGTVTLGIDSSAVSSEGR